MTIHLMPHKQDPFQHHWNDADNAPGGRPLTEKIAVFHGVVSYGSLYGDRLRAVWSALRGQMPPNPYSAILDELVSHPGDHRAMDMNQAITYLYAWVLGRSTSTATDPVTKL